MNTHALIYEYIHTYTVIFLSEHVSRRRHTMPNMKIGRATKSHNGKSTVIQICPLNIAVKLALKLCIWEVLGSILGHETGILIEVL
jgi:hypothetical protein